MPPTEVFSIICDDIRHEQYNKLPLIGTYTDGIIVSGLPISLPKLCFSQYIVDAPGVRKVKVKLRGPKLNIPPSEIEVEETTNAKLRLAIIFTNIKFELEGDYSFDVYLNEDKVPFSEKLFFVQLRPERQVH